MWKKVRLLLVILSVAFNVAFATMWVRHGGLPLRFGYVQHEDACTNGTAMCTLHRELDVSEKQWREIETHFVEFRKESRQICRKITRVRNEIIDLIASPNPDRETIRAKQEEIIAGQRRIQDLVIEQLLREKQELTPKQQRKLFDLIRKRSGCVDAAVNMGIGPGESPPVQEPSEGESHHEDRKG